MKKLPQSPLARKPFAPLSLYICHKPFMYVLYLIVYAGIGKPTPLNTPHLLEATPLNIAHCDAVK